MIAQPGRLRGVLLASACALPVATAAWAGDQHEPIHLDYKSGPDCPDEAAFVARVRSRTDRATLVGADDAERTFTVHLEAGSPSRGDVTVSSRGQPPLARHLEAPTCEEVANGLGLIVALAVDPRASIAAPASASASVPSPALAEPPQSPSAAPPPPATSSPLPPPLPTHPRETADGPEPSPEAPVPAREPQTVFAGADLAVATGVTPNSLVAGAVVVGWRGPSTSLVGASLRLAFLRADTGELTVSGGSASFTWTVGRVDACGLLWPKTPLRVGLCARLEAGVLDVSGVGDHGANTQHSPWLAVAPLAHAEWSILGSLFLNLDGGPSVRAVANRYYFQPDITAYTVPLVGLETEAGLAIYFL